MLSYLISLVKTSKEVGIPGIGTIYKKKSPGRYDVQTHSFLPPSYILAFSEELVDSYSLTEFVAQKRNISVAAATYFVEQFAEEINKQLNDHHEAKLGTLGTLHNHSGSLTFTAGDATSFGFEYYGMPPVKDELWSAVTPADAEIPVSDETENAAASPLNDGPAETTSETESSTDTTDTNKGTDADTDADNDTATDNPATEADDAARNISSDKDKETQADTDAENQGFAGEEQLELENSNADISDGDSSETPLSSSVIIDNEQPESQLSNDAIIFAPSQALDQDDEEAVYEEITELGLPEKVAMIVPLPEIETPEGVEHIEDHAHLHVKAAHDANTPRPTLNETLAQAAAARPVIEEPVGNAAIETPAEETPPVYYHLDDETPEKNGMPWYLKVIIVLLVIAIAAAATYVIKPELFEQLLYKNETEQPQLSNQALQKTADSIATADSIKQSIEAAMLADTLGKDSPGVSKEVPQPAQNSAAPGQKPVEQKRPEQAVEKTITAPTTSATPEVLPAGTTFEVIGSSLSSQKEADRFMAQMKKAGIKAKAFPGKKVIRISIATFKDDKSARAAIPALKEKLGINGLYVYTNKPE